MESENMEFSLDIQNLRNIQFDKYDKDFVFIVNGKEYETSRFVADLLSPTIRKLHYTDQTQNKFYIDTKQQPQEDYFEDFLKLANFERKQIESTRIVPFSEYFYELGNIYEYIKLRRGMIKEYNLDNIYEQLTIISKIIINENQSEQLSKIFKEMIDFCSANFEELDKEKLKKLEPFILELILCNPKLVVNNEETVLNFVLNKYEEDQQNNLIEFILIKNLSLEGLHNFVDKINLSDINIKTWHNICDRFFDEESEKPCIQTADKLSGRRYIKRIQNKEESKIKTFENSEGQETFNGIMRYLSKKTGGNIHNNGTIEITSNSINGNSQKPQNSVDFDNDRNHYCSSNLKDSNICFDFKDRRVQLTKYAIKSRDDGGPNYTNLKNWVIEASNDNTNWIELDRRENDSSLNGVGYVNTFKIQTPQTTFYRFIRLHQIGKSWHNSFHFAFIFIEFYGKLQEQ